MHEDHIYTNVSYVRGKVEFRGIDLSTGKRLKEQNSYNPRLYIPNVGPKRKGNYVNLFGEKLSYMEFGSPYDTWEFIKEYDSVDDFQIYGQKNFAFDYISRFLWRQSQDKWNIKHLRIAYLDIECESEDGFPSIDDPQEIINVITVYVSHKKRYATFCVGEAKIDDPDVDVYCFDTEQEMLYNFLAFWKVCDFDIVTGWNCRFFDMPYLYTRMAVILGEEKANQLSHHGKVDRRSVYMMGREQTCFIFAGVSILDYFDLYMKYAFTPLESYKLDTVAKHENIEGKIPWQEKYGSMKEFYKNNFQEFVEYNIQDVTIVKELEHKLRFIELHCSIAYMAGVNFDDAMSPIRTWEAFIYNKCFWQDIVCPIKNLKTVPDAEFQGAYVKEPKPGMYKWVASFDVTSLYPSIMRALNISPETYIKDTSTRIDIDDFVISGVMDEKITKHRSLSANGRFHTTNKQGILPQLITEVFDGRIIAKKELGKVKAQLEKSPDNHDLIDRKAQLQAKQMAYKILLNSLYGAVSNKYFLFYNLRQAEAVTLTGQLIIRRTAKILDEKLNKLMKSVNVPFVVYGDTDSVVGETIVEVNGKKMTIKKLFDSQKQNCVYEDTFNQSFVKPTDSLTTPSFNTSTGEVEEKPIKYVMKHKVKKMMYKITTQNGNEVIVTEDHSVIVRRNSRYMEAKPADIQETDEIIEILSN